MKNLLLQKENKITTIRQDLKPKNSTSGITLIALVITIIVLLILAGVTIAMLSGENGILSRATETRAYNDYFSADEQVKLAYMAVKTEIMANKASNGTYDATQEANAKALENIVKSELVKSGSGFEVAKPNNTKIQIKYSNASLKANGISAGVPAENGHINYLIILSSKDATLEPNKTESEFGTFIADTSDSGSDESGDDTITFTIDGVQYRTPAGSRWDEWANSEYNTDNMEFSSSVAYQPMDGGVTVMWNLLKLNGKLIHSSSVSPSRYTDYVGWDGKRPATIVSDDYVSYEQRQLK